MKKLILISLALLACSTSHAATINVAGGELYQGTELVNENPTGNTCYLYLDYVEKNSTGLHCYNLSTRPVFTTDRKIHPQDTLIVQSRVTNAHRPEYPAIKTCAMSLDGKTSGTDIYEASSETIFNHFFSWSGKVGSNQFDFFVTFSPETKQPVRTRLHKLNWFSETNYDCVDLEKL